MTTNLDIIIQKKGRNSTGMSHCVRNTIFSITSYPAHS